MEDDSGGVDRTVDARDAGREVVVAYRVPSGTVRLADVAAEYRNGG